MRMPSTNVAKNENSYSHFSLFQFSVHVVVFAVLAEPPLGQGHSIPVRQMFAEVVLVLSLKKKKYASLQTLVSCFNGQIMPPEGRPKLSASCNEAARPLLFRYSLQNEHKYLLSQFKLVACVIVTQLNPLSKKRICLTRLNS